MPLFLSSLLRLQVHEVVNIAKLRSRRYFDDEESSMLQSIQVCANGKKKMVPCLVVEEESVPGQRASRMSLQTEYVLQ